MDSRTTTVVISLLVVSVVTLAVMRMTVPSAPSVGVSSKTVPSSIEPKEPEEFLEESDVSKGMEKVTALPEAEDLLVTVSDF